MTRTEAERLAKDWNFIGAVFHVEDVAFYKAWDDLPPDRKQHWMDQASVVREREDAKGASRQHDDTREMIVVDIGIDLILSADEIAKKLFRDTWTAPPYVGYDEACEEAWRSLSEAERECAIKEFMAMPISEFIPASGDPH